MSDILNSPGKLLLLCFTLGLAPFVPEPHLWAKLKWIAGGAEGMTFMDWWDTIMHGAPWLLLLRASVLKANAWYKKEPFNKKGSKASGGLGSV